MTRKGRKKISRDARNAAAVRRSRQQSGARTRQRYDVLAMFKRFEGKHGR